MAYIDNPQGIRIERRNWYEELRFDIPAHFKWTAKAAQVASNLCLLEGTPHAIRYFAAENQLLDDYHYWFLLGTCWVRYTGFSDIAIWKELFNSPRRRRESSLMKPRECKIYRHILPKQIHAFRVHRPGETDWIAYTLDYEVARRFAEEREVPEIHEYILPRRDILALFLRRHEYEVLCLDKSVARLHQIHKAA